MAPPATGLAPHEVEAMVRRFLENEPGIQARPLRHGNGFLCTGPLGAERSRPRLFAVTTQGGVLVRLPEEARDRAVDRGVARANAALPEWVYEMDGPGRGARGARGAHGTPDEWVWIPLSDAQGFERRRPHILEALEYCRKRAAEPAA